MAGVTPCRGGWLVAAAKLHGTIFAPEDPIRMRPSSMWSTCGPAYSVMALNAPVGGLERAKAGGRTCDREARAPAGPAWVRHQERAGPVDSRDGTDLLPDHIDAISRTLLPRYQEVASEMAPFRQRTIYEVNSGTQLLPDERGRPDAMGEALGRGDGGAEIAPGDEDPGALRIIDAEVPGATLSHLLDAAAILWTGGRIFAKAAIRIPSDPEWDEQGIRMEIVR